MTSWPPQPVIYEVNTWVWLAALSAGLGRHVDLGTVPDATWDELVLPGIDAVWLMGVWERSPRGAEIALAHPGVDAEHRTTLADFTAGDVIGSAYCIRSYTVDPRLGGDGGLAIARRALAERGARLIVDYVPNHVALDHPWVTERPELFVRGDRDDAENRPREFVTVDGTVVALGRDPYFEPWQDVCQLNAFSPALRAQTAATLADIANRADGVRCDMAMLMLNDVFARTWGHRVGAPPPVDFWPDVIAQVRSDLPDLLFVAEVYWDLESVLLQQGFDYCYDKLLHDRLVIRDVAGLRAHLDADVTYQSRLVRFMENHDEPRAASALAPEIWRAAAVAVYTLPGALLLYEGQPEGRAARPPVALGRRPDEAADTALHDFYGRLLTYLARSGLRTGRWSTVELRGWPDNATADQLLAWWWTATDQHHLVVVNLSTITASGRVTVPPEFAAHSLTLIDPLNDDYYWRDATALVDGLFVQLKPGEFHLWRVTALPAPE